jgi:AcrR family transcriptional regulator
MPRTNPDARERLVAAAADMLRRRGLNATSIREVAKHAKAPLGSTYHYFPGGKQQMVSEAVQVTGEAVARLLRRQLAAGALPGLRAFVALWRDLLLSTDFRAGCPVVAVAAEEPDEDCTLAIEAAAQAFDSWEGLIADALASHVANRSQALNLASTIIASVEGAIALCRARRDIAPFDRVATTLEQLVLSHIGGEESVRPIADKA